MSDSLDGVALAQIDDPFAMDRLLDKRVPPEGAAEPGMLVSEADNRLGGDPGD